MRFVVESVEVHERESVRTHVDRRAPAGDSVVIRGLQSCDRELLPLILERLSPQSRIQRFLAPRPLYSERDLSVISRVDGVNHAGVIALAGSQRSPIGAAHWVRSGNTEVAETAIEVIDDWQRRGVGRLLIRELCVHATQAGIKRFEWFAFESNRAVAALACDLRDCSCRRIGDGVMKWSAAIG